MQHAWNPHVLLTLTLVLAAAACSPRDGADGAAGSEGPPGPVGPQGAPGEAGEPGGMRSSGFRLTLLHNNDGESALLGRGDLGGVARFQSVVKAAKRAAAAESDGVVLVSSGDNFMAGPVFAASDAEGSYFDATALELIGYDAICLGNHDFDFGPDILARFIGQFSEVGYLSANLGFSDEPALQAQIDAGRLKRSLVVEVGGELVGIVGATTEDLAVVASPRNVTVHPVLEAVQNEVDHLTAAGVRIVILISHLQGYAAELELAAKLRGVDILVAGGGDELLAGPTDPIIPGDSILAPYPVRLRGADGVGTLLVTTIGQYAYLGKLVVDFDEAGHVAAIVEEKSGPIRVTGDLDDADRVDEDPEMVEAVTSRVERFVEALDSQIIAQLEVPLNGDPAQIRAEETNLGDLVADAVLFKARALGAEYRASPIDAAIVNAGAIGAREYEAERFSMADVFSALPYGNFLAIVEDIPAERMKAVLENMVAEVEVGSGRFGQLSGLRIRWNPNGTARQVGAGGDVLEAGTRIEYAALLDDNEAVRRVLIDGGQIVDSTGTVTLVVPAFLAGGGDEYPLPGLSFIRLGTTGAQALSSYLQAPRGLGGLQMRVSADAYPVATLGRIERSAF